MTPDKKSELIIKRHIDSSRKKRLRSYTNFKELISPLKYNSINHIISAIDLEFDENRSANKTFNNF